MAAFHAVCCVIATFRVKHLLQILTAHHFKEQSYFEMGSNDATIYINNVGFKNFQQTSKHSTYFYLKFAVNFSIYFNSFLGIEHKVQKFAKKHCWKKFFLLISQTRFVN